jgi:hypothetical protein
VLGLIVLAAALARAALAFLFSQNPSIMPDESLYLNLARSLWLNGEVTLRGQSVTYDSLFYPLALAPLYLLPRTVDLFRAAQVLNAVFLSSAAIPAFLLARRVAGNRAGLFVAALTLMTPDMAMSEIVMADSLCYPLILWALWATHRALGADGGVRDALFAALFSALAFLAKPGYLALGVALSLALLILYVRTRSGLFLQKALTALFVLVAIPALMRIIGAHLLGIEYAVPSIYDTQMRGFSVARAIQSLNGALLYLFFFPAALCVFPVAMPVAFARTLPPTDRAFVRTLALAVLAIVLGTAYIIYINEYTGAAFAARVHLRYLAAFAPAFFALSLSPALRGRKLNGPLAALLAWMLAGTVAFTPAALLSNRSYPVDALLLSAMTSDTVLTSPKTLMALLLVLLVALGGYLMWRTGWTGKFKRGLFALLAALLLLNNASAYDLMRHNDDAAWAADANQAAAWTGGASTLFVAEDGGYFWNAATAFDARVRDALPVAELDDLVENTQVGGYYVEFVPSAYWTTAPHRLIAQPRYVVLDNALLYRVALTANVSAVATDNGKYAVLTLPTGAPWIHSALSGFTSGWATDDSRLTVFDAGLCAGTTLRVRLSVTPAWAGARLVVSCGDQTETFALAAGSQWIDWTFAIPGDGAPVTVSITPSDGDRTVYVDTYLVSTE